MLAVDLVAYLPVDISVEAEGTRNEVMSDRDNKTGPLVAEVSVFIGVLFCVAGVWMTCMSLGSGMLQGTFGLAMGASNMLPTLGCGALLIVAGHILRAVHRASDD